MVVCAFPYNIVDHQLSEVQIQFFCLESDTAYSDKVFGGVPDHSEALVNLKMFVVGHFLQYF